MSKVPIKYTSLPLNVVYELVYKTNMKLNLSRQNLKLIEDNEIATPEYHTIRFEGKIGEFTNQVDGVLKMRNRYKKCKKSLSEGNLDDVEIWTITNIDSYIEDAKKGI